MTPTISPLTLPAVWHVVKNMRQSDWIEVSNLVPRAICTVDGIAMATVQHSGAGFVAALDGVPVCVVQLGQRHDGCWSCGLFATDDFPKVWRTVLKEVHHVIIPTLIDQGARYCEAHVLADNLPAQAMLKRIGFSAKSSVLTNYGAFGKDFVLFAVTREELTHVFFKPEDSRAQGAD